MSYTTKLRYIHAKTGEIFNSDEIIIDKELVKSKYKSIKDTNNFINDNLGYYFHLIYETLLELNLESQMIIRFIKLCCYSDYKNILTNGNTKAKSNILEENLIDILKLSRAEYFKTKKYLVENNLIFITNSCIKINDKYSLRGKLTKELKNKEFTRVFSKGFIELYDNTTPIQHKKLAVFIQLLPYINVHYNVVCLNVKTNNFDESQPLQSTEIANLCGYEKTSRFIKDLLSLKIKDMYVLVKITRGDRDFFVVNPRIYYKGNNIEKLKYIMNFFDYKTS